MSPPLPTEAAFDAHMATIDAIVAARPVLNFTLPCMDGPQNASDDPDAAPNTSMTGEFFNELEHGWKVMLERASGEQHQDRQFPNTHGQAGPLRARTHQPVQEQQ